MIYTPRAAAGPRLHIETQTDITDSSKTGRTCALIRKVQPESTGIQLTSML